MGIRPTILPWLVLGGGLAGCVVALLLQWWTNAIDYPFMISGKPLFSLPANHPGHLRTDRAVAALTAFVGVLALNQLPQFWHPVVREPAVPPGDDRRVLPVDRSRAIAKFDEAETRTLLESAGAVAVEVCRGTDRRTRSSQGDLLGVGRAGGAGLAAAVGRSPGIAPARSRCRGSIRCWTWTSSRSIRPQAIQPAVRGRAGERGRPVRRDGGRRGRWSDNAALYLRGEVGEQVGDDVSHPRDVRTAMRARPAATIQRLSVRPATV